MSTVSLLATDLDGTLFYDREHTTDADCEALARAAAAGVTVAIATGRHTDAILPALDRYALRPYIHYIIHSGGAYLYEMSTQREHTLGALSPTVMGDIFDRYAGYGMPIVLSVGSTMYVNHITDRLRREAEILSATLVEVPDFKSIMTAPNGKLVFNGSAEQIDRLLPLLTADPDPRWTAYRSHDNYIDCYAAGVNKGSALTQLCERLGLTLDRAAAIGDNHNDLDLLRTAGIAGCPGDGAPDAKALADYICCPAREGAVADFCRWLGI